MAFILTKNTCCALEKAAEYQGSKSYDYQEEENKRNSKGVVTVEKDKRYLVFAYDQQMKINQPIT